MAPKKLESNIRVANTRRSLVAVVVNSNNRSRCACRLLQQKKVSRAHTPQARQPRSLPNRAIDQHPINDTHVGAR